ncbi:MAG TPA: DUF6677 family protein, partial [Phycisphaerales bacterium]|nr:DUF6677 family protein [Phycisphaerales bacterium]
MSTSSPQESRPQPTVNAVAAICAFVFPGLGHIVIGQKRRGVLIMTGILFLFLSGLLIGGVDVVDRRHDRLWFYAQGLCGPIAYAADYLNQSLTKPIPSDLSSRTMQDIENDPATLELLSRQSLAHVNEMGTLFCALAGLMNFVVIL